MLPDTGKLLLSLLWPEDRPPSSTTRLVNLRHGTTRLKVRATNTYLLLSM